MPTLTGSPSSLPAERAALEARLAHAQAACVRWRLRPGCTELYLEASCDVESLERQLGLLDQAAGPVITR